MMESTGATSVSTGVCALCHLPEKIRGELLETLRSYDEVRLEQTQASDVNPIIQNSLLQNWWHQLLIHVYDEIYIYHRNRRQDLISTLSIEFECDMPILEAIWYTAPEVTPRTIFEHIVYHKKYFNENGERVRL